MTKTPQNIHYSSFFNARLTSTISIALVLFILGLIALIGIMASEISMYVKENIGFSIVLKDNLKENEINRMKQQLEKTKFVKSVTFLSKEEALKELTAELGENPEEFLGFNPLQASLEVKLKAQYANADSLQWIEKKLNAYSGISEIAYRKDLIQLVNENVKRIGAILLLLAGILMVISFALISNTIRLSAYSKRFLIHTMKLVGATPAFIRRPFIVSNIVNGIVASVFAIGMLTGCIYYLSTAVENFSILMSLDYLISVYLIVFILGIFLTAISAYFAVNKYIRMNHDDLYYV